MAMAMAMAMAPRRTLLGGRGDVGGRALRVAVGVPARQATAAAFFGTMPSTTSTKAAAPSRLPLLPLSRPRLLATTSSQQQQQAVVGVAGRGRGTTATARWSSSSSSSSPSDSDSDSDSAPVRPIVWTFESIQEYISSPSPSSSKRKVTIVDVREPGEIASTGRIPGAINIPVTSAPEAFHATAEDFEDRFGFERPPRDAEVLFYCKAGVRSHAAAGLARDAGWSAVGEYPGSWADWVAKGGKIER